MKGPVISRPNRELANQAGNRQERRCEELSSELHKEVTKGP